MFLFIISLIFICISSFLITLIVFQKSCNLRNLGLLEFVSFFLTIFAQVVLTFEILSLLKQINQFAFIIFNFIFLIFSYIIFARNQISLAVQVKTIKLPFKRFINSLKLDKSLGLLFLFFIFFATVSIVMGLLLPITSYDAQSYHLARVPFWISNSSLNHFPTADIRMLSMPINSELLYSWPFVFVKQDWFVGIFSFCGFILSCCGIYGLLSELGFCLRKKLWTIFLFSSIASVVVEASGSETEIIIAGLILVCLYFLFLSVKTNSLKLMYFSSLAYALAVGTKTPAIMFLPSLIVLFLSFFFIYSRKETLIKIKRFSLLFSLYFFVNFILFASYNYVLNFINYLNFFGSPGIVTYHSFYGGFQAFIANAIKYFLLLFDFSGFSVANLMKEFFLTIQQNIFNFLGIQSGIGVVMKVSDLHVGETISSLVGIGLIGTFVFVPMIIYSLFILLKKRNKTTILGLFSLTFLFNILILSFSLGFMPFSIRFLSFFVMVASPIFVLSYIKSNKNIVKIFIIYLCFSYMVVISGHLSERPFFKLLYLYKHKSMTLSQFRDQVKCSDDYDFSASNPACIARDVVLQTSKNYDSPVKIGLAVNSDFRTYPIKLLESKNYKIDYFLFEFQDISEIDKYDYFITNNEIQTSTYFKLFSEKVSAYRLIDNKVDFFHNNDLYCYYLNRFNKILQKNNDDVPVTCVCYIPVKTIAHKNFYPIAQIVVDKSRKKPLEDIIIYKKM